MCILSNSGIGWSFVYCCSSGFICWYTPSLLSLSSAEHWSMREVHFVWNCCRSVAFTCLNICITFSEGFIVPDIRYPLLCGKVDEFWHVRVRFFRCILNQFQPEFQLSRLHIADQRELFWFNIGNLIVHWWPDWQCALDCFAVTAFDFLKFGTKLPSLGYVTDF